MEQNAYKKNRQGVAMVGTFLVQASELTDIHRRLECHPRVALLAS